MTTNTGGACHDQHAPFTAAYRTSLAFRGAWRGVGTMEDHTLSPSASFPCTHVEQQAHRACGGGLYYGWRAPRRRQEMCLASTFFRTVSLSGEAAPVQVTTVHPW